MAMLNNQMVIWCTAAFSVGWHMLHCCWATSRFPDKSSELQLWPLTTAALNDMDTSSPTGEETVSSPKQRTGYPGKGRPQNRSQNVSDACEPQVNERLQTDYEYIQICLPLYLQCCFLQIGIPFSSDLLTCKSVKDAPGERPLTPLDFMDDAMEDDDLAAAMAMSMEAAVRWQWSACKII